MTVNIELLASGTVHANAVGPASADLSSGSTAMSLRLLLLAVPVLISFAGITNAATINFTQTDLLRSTVEGFQEITAPNGVSPATMPADGTFTLAPNTVLGNDFSGTWFRFNFNLPAGFTGLSMNIQLFV